MRAPLDLDVLNAADPVAFAAAVGPLFEGAPRFLARLAAARPFPDWPSLFEVARVVAHAAPDSEQVELINAHPRLGAAKTGMSELSSLEQGHDRDAVVRVADEAGAERERVAAVLERLNAAYEARFGFRYCVFVAGRSRADLVPELEAALDGAPDTERHRALDAVVDIAIDRLSTVHRPVA